MEGAVGAGAFSRRLRATAWSVVVFCVLFVPVFIFYGQESFRVPKQSLLTLGCAVLMTIAAVSIASGRNIDFTLLRRPAIAIAVAAVLWTLVTAALSTNRVLSLVSLVWVLTFFIFFIATFLLARGRSPNVVLWLFPGALVNAVVLTLQTTEIWTPFVFPEYIEASGNLKIKLTALVGNPNDVGAYFVAPALAATTFAIVSSGWRRAVALVLALVCAGGVFMSETVTAIVALAAGMVAIGAVKSWRRALIVAAIALTIAGGIVAGYQPLRDRSSQLFNNLRRGEIEQFLSSRLTAFLAAGHLARSRPWIGTGPGTFGFHYFDAKLEVERRLPRFVSGDPFIFHEVHNDHLQVLAQTGTIGYVIFLAALLVLAAKSIRRPRDDTADEATRMRSRFVELTALPLAIAFAVEGLAGFPLELTAPMLAFLYVAGLCEAWS